MTIIQTNTRVQPDLMWVEHSSKDLFSKGACFPLNHYYARGIYMGNPYMDTLIYPTSPCWVPGLKVAETIDWPLGSLVEHEMRDWLLAFVLAEAQERIVPSQTICGYPDTHTHI